MLIRKAAEKQTKDAEMTDRSRRAKEKKLPRAPKRISMQWTCYCTTAHTQPWSNDIGRSTCYYMSPSGLTCPGVRDEESSDTQPLAFGEVAGFEKWRYSVARTTEIHNAAATAEKPAWYSKENERRGEPELSKKSNFMNVAFKLQDSFWQCDCNFVNLSSENWLVCKNCKADRMHCNVGLIHAVCTMLNPTYGEMNFDPDCEELSKNILRAAWFSPKIAKIFAVQYMDMSTYKNDNGDHVDSLHLTVEWFERILEHFKESLHSDPEDVIDALLEFNCEYETCKQALEKRKKKELMEEAAYDPYEVVNQECIICFDEITESEDPTINNFCLMPCGHKRVCSKCVGMLRATGEECPDCALGIEATVIYHPILPNLTLVRSQGHTYSPPRDHFQQGPWNARW